MEQSASTRLAGVIRTSTAVDINQGQSEDLLWRTRDWLSHASKADGKQLEPNLDLCEELYGSLLDALQELYTSSAQASTVPPLFWKETFTRLFLWGREFRDGRLSFTLGNAAELRDSVLKFLKQTARLTLDAVTEADSLKHLQNLRALLDQPSDRPSAHLEDATVAVNATDELSGRAETDPLIRADERDAAEECTSEDGQSIYSASTCEADVCDLLQTEVDCLMDLLPSIEQIYAHLQLTWENPARRRHNEFSVSAEALPFVKYVADKFVGAEDILVQRLGESNWQRFMALRARREQILHTLNEPEDAERAEKAASELPPSIIFKEQSIPKSMFVPQTLFYDSGLGTSIPSLPRRALTEASHTSFLSSVVANGDTSVQVPKTPSAVSRGEAFNCDICGATLRNIRNRIDWKRHIFEDLQPYICTFPSCEKHLVKFATRNQWADHEFTEHRVARSWTCPECQRKIDTESGLIAHLRETHSEIIEEHQVRSLAAASVKTEPAAIEDQQCALCQEKPGKSRRHFVKHLARHLESIALAVLPREGDYDSGQDSDASMDSHYSRISIHQEDPPMTEVKIWQQLELDGTLAEAWQAMKAKGMTGIIRPQPLQNYENTVQDAERHATQVLPDTEFKIIGEGLIPEVALKPGLQQRTTSATSIDRGAQKVAHAIRRRQSEEEKMQDFELELWDSCRVLHDWPPYTAEQSPTLGETCFKVTKDDEVQALRDTVWMSNAPEFKLCRADSGTLGYLPATILEVVQGSSYISSRVSNVAVTKKVGSPCIEPKQSPAIEADNPKSYQENVTPFVPSQVEPETDTKLDEAPSQGKDAVNDERRVWICVDASGKKALLANCKACQQVNSYDTWNDAAAHLQRVHFTPKQESKDTGDTTHWVDLNPKSYPSVEELQSHWMLEVKVSVYPALKQRLMLSSFSSPLIEKSSPSEDRGQPSKAINDLLYETETITYRHSRERPFVCTMEPYGCSATFTSKNKWSRHVFGQHTRLGFWRCGLEPCVPRPSPNKDETEEEAIYNDFNRQDLFLQHLRRRHFPNKHKAISTESLKKLADSFYVRLREPPPKSICGYCNALLDAPVIFEGPGAWEARMEHVGQHMVIMTNGKPVRWLKDHFLQRWLIEKKLIESDAQGWRLSELQSYFDEQAAEKSFRSSMPTHVAGTHVYAEESEDDATTQGVAAPPDIFSAAFDPFSGFDPASYTGMVGPASPEAPDLEFCSTAPSSNLPSTTPTTTFSHLNPDAFDMAAPQVPQRLDGSGDPSNLEWFMAELFKPFEHSPVDPDQQATAADAHPTLSAEEVNMPQQERHLPVSATWDFIRNHDSFKNGELDMADVTKKLKGRACVAEAGPVLKLSEVIQAINESRTFGNDHLNSAPQG